MFSRDQKFSLFEYEQLTKDFCYNKPLSLHLRTHNLNTSVELQEQVEVKSGKCSLSDRAEITHSIQNRTIKATLATGSVKLYYGHELQKLTQEGTTAQAKNEENDESTMIYSRLFADRKFQNASVQLGLFKRTPSFQMDTNISACLFERQNEYYVYSKLLWKGKLASFGVISLFDYSCRNLQTNNVVFEIKPHAKHRLYARGEVDGLRNYSLRYSKIASYFDYLILDYIFRPTDSLALMAEYKYDFNAKKMKTVESIIEKRFSRNTLKVGINQLADVTFQMSFPLSLGNNSKLDFGIQVADILKGRKISYGFKIDISA